jgi:hypothetical protein
VAWKDREHSFLPSTLTRVQPIAQNKNLILISIKFSSSLLLFSKSRLHVRPDKVAGNECRVSGATSCMVQPQLIHHDVSNGERWAGRGFQIENEDKDRET